MTTVFVQFADASESAVVSIFGCAQDPAIWPNQGAIDSTDARYKAFFETLPDLAKASTIPPI